MRFWVILGWGGVVCLVMWFKVYLCLLVVRYCGCEWVGILGKMKYFSVEMGIVMMVVMMKSYC